jgi:hypothetical protein
VEVHFLVRYIQVAAPNHFRVPGHQTFQVRAHRRIPSGNLAAAAAAVDGIGCAIDQSIRTAVGHVRIDQHKLSEIDGNGTTLPVVQGLSDAMCHADDSQRTG